MSRTGKFMRNAAASALNQIVVLIVGFITPSLMIRTYGSELNGLVSSLTQFITYITLVEAGLSGAVTFSLYKPLAQRDFGAVSRIIAAAKKSYTQVGLIFSGGILVLALVYAGLKSTDSLSFGLIFWLTLILGANGCLEFFLLSQYKVLFTADQKFYIITHAATAQTIFRTLVVCLCAIWKMDVLLLYGIALVPIVFKVAVLIFVGKRQYLYLDRKAQPDSQALSKRWAVIYQQILGTVQTGAPTVLATLLVSLKMVSVYSVYNMILSGINGLMAIFISGLPAGFGEVIARGERETLRKSVSEFEVAYYLLITVVYGITLVMILPFVRLYTRGFPEDIYYYPVLAVTMVLNGLLYNIKTPQSMLIISAGMYKETKNQVTIQGVIILVLGTVLGYQWGMPGIMIGSCISNLYRTIDLLHFVPRNITFGGGEASLVRMARVLMSLVIITIPFLFVQPEPATYLQWVLYAVAVGVYAVAVALMMAVLFDRKELVQLLRRVKRMLQRGT